MWYLCASLLPAAQPPERLGHRLLGPHQRHHLPDALRLVVGRRSLLLSLVLALTLLLHLEIDR